MYEARMKQWGSASVVPRIQRLAQANSLASVGNKSRIANMP